MMVMSVPGKPSKTRHAVRITLVVLVIAALLLFGRGRLAERRYIAEVKGTPAAEFELTGLDGETVRSSELRGKPIVLAFWAVG